MYCGRGHAPCLHQPWSSHRKGTGWPCTGSVGRRGRGPVSVQSSGRRSREREPSPLVVPPLGSGYLIFKGHGNPKQTVRKGLIRDSDAHVLRKPPVPLLMAGLCRSWSYVSTFPGLPE